MPIGFLSAAERARLNQLPEDLPRADLIAYFTLSATDLLQIPRKSSAHNRLGFALQLCALRYLGFSPFQIRSTSASITAYVAEQLKVDPQRLKAYGRRGQTRTEHQQLVESYLGFRKPTEQDINELRAWLLPRALEHDRPIFLLQLACERLRAMKIVRPGLTSLQRLIASTRRSAQRETYRVVSPLLTAERKTLLDGLLVPQDGRTALTWLRQHPTRSTPHTISDTIEKLKRLQGWGVPGWNLAALNPNRLKFLAQVGRRSTNQALQRLAEERRYPILLAFLTRALQGLTDEAVDLFDRCLADTYARARRELDEFRLSVATLSNEKVKLLRELGRIVLDPDVEDPQVRASIYRRIPQETLRSAVEQCDEIVRPSDDNYFDLMGQRYGYLRQFAPAFLEALAFHSNQRDAPLLQAVDVLRKMNAAGLRRVPAGTSTEFVPSQWRAFVVEQDGSLDRRYFELCVLWELRAALRAGDVWLEHSRRYANLDSYLIPRERWPVLRPEVCTLLGTPADGTLRLAKRREQLAASLERFDKCLPQHDSLRLEDDRLVVGRLKGEERPASLLALEQQIDARLPLVELPDLLLEVDAWTGLSSEFQHASGNEPRTEDLLILCHASVLAQACNFGLTRMAQVSNLSYERLAWCTMWHLREETLRPANTRIVNFQYRQPLAQRWGGGTLSSSDGQRFPVAVRSTTATAIPRYFGYGRGLSLYSWTSDQFSQYGSKPAPSTMRDATIVLDGILDNETELHIVEHTTDTAGYTDLVFGLFDLLGLRFSPRLRDLGGQRLYRIDTRVRYQHIEPLVRGTIKPDLILKHWDELLRVAGSLKLGWVTASLFIAKLQAFRRQNALTRALQEYGRIAKTLFILDYLEDVPFQRRIGVQLNKGEALHALRRFLFSVANEGQVRRRHLEEQINQASCLNLVTNAVVAWNTVYMSAILDQLRAEGFAVDDADVAHLSPARYEHINPYGKYQFDLGKARDRSQLRPLRRL